MGLYQIKKLLQSKGNNQQCEYIEPTEWEKCFPAIHLTEGWYPEYIKNSKKLISNSINKWENSLNRFFSNEEQMANKYMKKYIWKSLAVRELQIKISLLFHLSTFRMAIIFKKSKCWWRCGKKATLKCSWWEYISTSTWEKTTWSFPAKLKIDLQYNPATPPLIICLKEMKPTFRRGTWISMFIAALFTISKIGNQS
jgi:hypothetical protein